MDLITRILFGLLYFIIIWLYYFFVNKKCLFISGTNLFIIFQLIFFYGTLFSNLDVKRSIFYFSIGIQIIGIIYYILGVYLTNKYYQINIKKAYDEYLKKDFINDFNKDIKILIIFLALISIIIGFWFSFNYGGNAIFKLINDYFQGQKELASKYSELRASAIYSDKYLGIGYVRQITDFIFPFCIFMFLFIPSNKNRLVNRTALIILIFLSFYFITLTGRRDPILRILLMFILLIYPKYGLGLYKYIFNFKFKKKFITYSIFLVFLSYSIFTLISSIRYGGSFSILSGIKYIWQRLGIGIAEEHLEIMDFFQNEPITYGKSWIEMLSTIRPGHQSGLDNYIHMVIFGSKGSAPLNIWESSWHNFGLIGIIFVPFLLGLLIQTVSIKLLTGRKTSSEVVLMMLISIQMSNFNEPYSFFNEGVITYFIILFIIKLLKKRYRFSYRFNIIR